MPSFFIAATALRVWSIFFESGSESFEFLAWGAILYMIRIRFTPRLAKNRAALRQLRLTHVRGSETGGPKADRLAVTTRETVLVGRQLDETALTGRLLVQFPEVEQGIGAKRICAGRNDQKSLDGAAGTGLSGARPLGGAAQPLGEERPGRIGKGLRCKVGLAVGRPRCAGDIPVAWLIARHAGAFGDDRCRPGYHRQRAKAI